jgi:protein gp37
MNTTTIEWAEKTWNPVTGCTPVSEGCEHCYAKRMAQRLRGRCGYPEDDPFKVTFHPDRLERPLKLKKPSRIFVCSMGDLFHDDVGYSIVDIFDVMSATPQHTYILLTKRPERMRSLFRLNGPLLGSEPLPNVWLGVTAENQARADERIPILLQIPAAVRFVSVEPMLGPVDMSEWFGLYQLSNDKWALKVGSRWKDSPDWIIVGGETGPGARPMHPDWVRSLRDQCRAARVPFLFKQWGEWRPLESADSCPLDKVGYWYRGWRPFTPLYSADGHSFTIGVSPWGAHMARVGRRTAGRILDGRIWDEYPEVMT